MYDVERAARSITLSQWTCVHNCHEFQIAVMIKTSLINQYPLRIMTGAKWDHFFDRLRWQPDLSPDRLYESPQKARNVLPLCTKTELIMTEFSVGWLIESVQPMHTQMRYLRITAGLQENKANETHIKTKVLLYIMGLSRGNRFNHDLDACITDPLAVLLCVMDLSYHLSRRWLLDW